MKQTPIQKAIEEDFDEEIEFERCSQCDGHEACLDFGCAIKQGIIFPKDF